MHNLVEIDEIACEAILFRLSRPPETARSQGVRSQFRCQLANDPNRTRHPRVARDHVLNLALKGDALMA